MNKFRFALLLAMSVLLVAGSAFAQTATTGAIVGTVAQAGTPLPGVTLELKSPSLQGVRTEVTDAKGQFQYDEAENDNRSGDDEVGECWRERFKLAEQTDADAQVPIDDAIDDEREPLEPQARNDGETGQAEKRE